MANQESAGRFAAALDHLGSRDPVVRVGSFAELDRLAAEDLEYAQAVADVVGAYPGMPFVPPRYATLPVRRLLASASPVGVCTMASFSRTRTSTRRRIFRREHLLAVPGSRARSSMGLCISTRPSFRVTPC